jgi:alkanesulfonate monooxygenase SsuD/methylene tetrahydromethanopterin reductase-like flavin-dependent oxidoreductase (luciferase family)
MPRQLSLSFSPMRDAGPQDIVAWSQAAEAAGYAGVFIPESFNDSLSYALAVALRTQKLLVGTAIANIYLRHRTLLAQQAAAVQEFSGGRLVLGLGVGHRAVNRSIGIEMGDTFADLRATVELLRGAWVKGPHQPRPTTPPALYAAALAPKMVELVGEVCDGAIFNLFPLARYPKALEWLRRGAERAGKDPGGVAVCHFTTAYLSDDRDAALYEAKRMLSRYANLPFYGNMLAAAGFAAEVATVRGHMANRDTAKAEAAVSDAMADAVTLAGDPARCRERIDAYFAAGATHVIVFPNPVGESRADATHRAIEGLAPRG